MVLDDSWFDDGETFEFFKVLAAYEIGEYPFTSIMKMFNTMEDQILYLRLEIIRRKCDRLGGPEIVPLSSAAK